MPMTRTSLVTAMSGREAGGREADAAFTVQVTLLPLSVPHASVDVTFPGLTGLVWKMWLTNTRLGKCGE